MHHTPRIVIVAATCALMACNPSSPPAKQADAGRNVAAPAAATAAQKDVGNAATAATGTGLWNVAEAEDEASHRGIDVIAFNRSGRTVAALALRPDEGPLAPGATPDPWSANVLAQSELPDGQRAAAHYESDIELCRWQVRATFADRQTRDYPSVNLCETIRVDLR